MALVPKESGMSSRVDLLYVDTSGYLHGEVALDLVPWPVLLHRAIHPWRHPSEAHPPTLAPPPSLATLLRRLLPPSALERRLLQLPLAGRDPSVPVRMGKMSHAMGKLLPLLQWSLAGCFQ